MPGEGSLEVRERGGRESWMSASTPPRGIPPHHHIAIIAPPVQPCKLHFSHPTPAINDDLSNTEMQQMALPVAECSEGENPSSVVS